MQQSQRHLTSADDASSPQTSGAAPAHTTLAAARASTAGLRLAFEQVAPPLLAFAIVRVMLSLIAKDAGFPPLRGDTWGRWDTAHYSSIAERGYEFFSCSKMGLPGYDPKTWCGNAAWLPGYPLLMRWFAKTGLSIVDAGALVSAVLCLATLVLIWNLFLKSRFTLKNLLVLGLAAFFPGHVYDHAVFPISLLTVCALLSLHCYIERRFVAAGLFGAAAAFSYSSGLFLGAVLGVHWLFADRSSSLRERARALLAPAGVAFGFIAMLLYQFSEVHKWKAYFLVQVKYEYAFRMPFVAWHAAWDKAVGEWPTIGGPSQQTLLVAVLCISVLVVVLGHVRELERADAVLIWFMLFYWLVPLMMGGQLSIYRAEATILPAIALFRRLPTWLLIPGLACAIMLSRVMARLFFLNHLV